MYVYFYLPTELKFRICFTESCFFFYFAFVFISDSSQCHWPNLGGGSKGLRNTVLREYKDTISDFVQRDTNSVISCVKIVFHQL
jgi:hypothetical protein